jgi:hypothetical protein
MSQKRDMGHPDCAGTSESEQATATVLLCGSVLAVAAFDGVEEFGGVVAYAVFEDDFDFFNVVDVGGGVAVDDDEVGVFAGGDGADGRLLAHVGRAVQGRDFDGFEWGEAAGFNEEFNFALVSEAGEGTAVAGGIEAGDEEASGGDEFVLELGAVVVGLGTGGVLWTAEFHIAGVEIGLACGRGHGFEDTVLDVEMLRDGALEDGEGAGDGDVVVDEELDEGGGVGAVGVHAGEGGVAGGARAEIGLFTGIVLRVDEESMLEIVDACFGGFGVGDGAEVAGDLDAVLVGGVDGGFELGAGDVHVGLVAGDSLGGPVVDEGAGVVGAGEVVHLDEGAVGAFEVGGGDVHVRADEMSGVDFAAEVEVDVGLDASGGADGGDSGGEVHARGREAHLGDDERWLGGAVGGFVGAGDVVHVIVHADEAGDDGVAVEIDDGGAGSGGGFFGDAGDLAVFDEDGLIFEGRGAGAVDDADVGEENGWGVDFDVLEDVGGESGGLDLGLGVGCDGEGGEQGRS